MIKVENPVNGDDTRQWANPNLKDKEGHDIKGESAYYHCCNRNKKSVTIDFAHKEGQDLVRRLAKNSDVVVENFRVGKLKEYGLSYEDLKAVNSKIVYASVTGYGQTVLQSLSERVVICLRPTSFFVFCDSKGTQKRRGWLRFCHSGKGRLDVHHR